MPAHFRGRTPEPFADGGIEAPYRCEARRSRDAGHGQSGFGDELAGEVQPTLGGDAGRRLAHFGEEHAAQLARA